MSEIKKGHFGPSLIGDVSRCVMQIIVLKTLNVAFKGQQDFILSSACLFSAGTFMESDQCRSSFDKCKVYFQCTLPPLGSLVPCPLNFSIQLKSHEFSDTIFIQYKIPSVFSH